MCVILTSTAPPLPQREAFHCSAYAEIALGFLLIFQLVTPMRNLTLIFFYWNLLKMRYQTPDSSASHRQVGVGGGFMIIRALS